MRFILGAWKVCGRCAEGVREVHGRCAEGAREVRGRLPLVATSNHRFSG